MADACPDRADLVVALSHQPFLLIITYRFAGAGFNKVNWLGVRSRTASAPILARCDNAGATHPKMMSVGLHPRLIGQASRIHALREFLEYVEAKGGAWITRRIDIPRWWHEHHASFPV